MLVQLLRDYEERYGLVIRPGWIVNDVSLTIGPLRTVITYSGHLPEPNVILGVTTMIEVLELSWEGTRFRVRYPLPDDDRIVKADTARTRRDYRIPERRARRRLLPDSLISRAVREEWENWQLLEACQLDEVSCEARIAEWREKQLDVVFMSQFDWEGPIPF